MEKSLSDCDESTQVEALTPSDLAAPDDADRLVRRLRLAVKRRRQLLGWVTPFIVVGMAVTLFVFSRIDLRLSLCIFGVSAAIVAIALTAEAAHWGRLASKAAEIGDVRAIGPLLVVLNERDSSAGEPIEEALIELLPCVQRLSQLSKTARLELNRLLLEFEMPGLRGGHNAELARIALEVVARFRDCSSLPAVRRLADGFTATRPSAAIRDLAGEILPDLEKRAALLRASCRDDDFKSHLRPAGTGERELASNDLVLPVPAGASDHGSL